jgi:hypothetical protein
MTGSGDVEKADLRSLTRRAIPPTLDRRLALDAGVVDEDVELAEPYAGFVHEAPGVVGIAHVGDDRGDRRVLVRPVR